MLNEEEVLSVIIEVVEELIDGEVLDVDEDGDSDYSDITQDFCVSFSSENSDKSCYFWSPIDLRVEYFIPYEDYPSYSSIFHLEGISALGSRELLRDAIIKSILSEQESKKENSLRWDLNFGRMVSIEHLESLKDFESVTVRIDRDFSYEILSLTNR